MRAPRFRPRLALGDDVEEAQVHDHSYGQAYAEWQAELRTAATAPTDRRARRIRPRPSTPRGRRRPVRAWWRVLRPWSVVGR